MHKDVIVLLFTMAMISAFFVAFYFGFIKPLSVYIIAKNTHSSFPPPDFENLPNISNNQVSETPPTSQGNPRNVEVTNQPKTIKVKNN